MTPDDRSTREALRRLDPAEVTDATTRQHARPHLDADPLEVALEAWRRGQPCDLTTLTRAGAITIGQAHEAWRDGLWRARLCEVCPTCVDDNGPECVRTQVPTPSCGECVDAEDCQACLGTGLQWSERHAGLLGFAGEDSLRLGDEQRLRVALRGADGVAGFAEELRHWSDLAPLAAAWGVAWAWAMRARGCTLRLAPPDQAALDAVWRYLCDPSEERRALVVPPGDLDQPMTPLDWLALGVRGVEWVTPAMVIERADESAGLGEEATSCAAREGVRRWAGRVWGVDGAPL